MRRQDATAWLRKESRAVQRAADLRELDNSVSVCYWLVGQGMLPKGIYRRAGQCVIAAVKVLTDAHNAKP